MKKLFPLLLAVCLISCKKEALLDIPSFEKSITNSLLIIEKPKGEEFACQIDNRCIGIVCDEEYAGKCVVHPCQAVACPDDFTTPSIKGGRVALTDEKVNEIANKILKKMIEQGYIEKNNSAHHLKFYSSLVKNHNWN